MMPDSAQDKTELLSQFALEGNVEEVRGAEPSRALGSVISVSVETAL